MFYPGLHLDDAVTLEDVGSVIGIDGEAVVTFAILELFDLLYV